MKDWIKAGLISQISPTACNPKPLSQRLETKLIKRSLVLLLFVFVCRCARPLYSLISCLSHPVTLINIHYRIYMLDSFIAAQPMPNIMYYS